MEIPIQVAVRIFPVYPNELCRVETFPKYIDDNLKQCGDILSNGCQPGIDEGGVGLVQVTRSRLIEDNNGNALDNEKSSFKIRHALPYGCPQEFIYRNTVQPMIRNFLEGYDVSIVTYGQSVTGKTYCMYGPGFDGVYNEMEYGIVPRAICDIFSQLSKRPSGCRFSVNIAWIEVNGNEIHDILGGRIIQCNNLNDAFHLLRIGFANRNTDGTHSIFTITIEQQWVSPDGLLQHRLSTASFCDLSGTQRIVNEFNEEISVPKDPGLRMLERIVISLCDSTMLENERNLLMNHYEETMLTRLLKDSFGGRAQTLLICCVSPLEEHTFETIENLHFAYKTQFVRNAVILNTFSDNNMPISNFLDPTAMIDPRLIKFPPYNPADAMNKVNPTTQNASGTEFTANWTKLIANAEGLFNKLLINNKLLNDNDRECIEEWMYLKQECESFSSAGLISNGGRLLKPIQETDENSENDERSNGEILDQEKTDHSGQNATFSDNESDADENLEHVEAKIPDLMINFSRHVNKMIEDYYKNYVDTYPKAVLNSYDDKPKELAIVAAGVATNRRRSVQAGDSNSGLSSSELDHLNRIAEETTKERLEESIRNSQQMCLNTTVGREATAFLENSDHLHPLRMATRHQSEVLFLNHIRRFRTDIEAKESKITELKQNIKIKKELMKINSGRDKAKRVLNRKVASLETKKERCIKAMERCEKKEIDKWKMELSKIETQLTEISRLRAISQHSDNTIKGFQQDIEISDKQLKMLEKALEADKKSLREAETKWKSEKAKNAKTAKEEKRMSVDTRITQFDSVLKEKSEYLQKNNDESEMVQSIRHEIRNLRSQRDRLTDAQCLLNQKLKKERLTEWETRKILEYDVAKEVIDHAMEMKNQLICGRDMLNRKSVGNPDLMSQLNKLNEKEMRVLLYKCFQKIVDLRDSSRQLEIQLLQLEQERNEWKLRERVLCDEFQQSRLVGERNTLDLQRHYERTLTMLLQRAGEDCAESPNIPSDSFMLPSPYSPFTHSNNRHHAIRNEIGFGIHDYKSANQHQQHAYRFANTAVATTSKREIAEREIADALNNPKQKATGSLFFRRFASSNGFKRNIPQLLMANGTPQNTTTESKVSLVKRKNSSRKIIIQQNKP